ncbi:MAG: GspH/FimT family pseudopilin [Pseudomonadota bacterium]
MNTQKQSAFTLIEAMITLSVLAILVAVAMPNLSGFLQDNRLTSHTNTLVATLNYARGEAITRNRAVNLTAVSPTDSSNEWGQGWTIWSDLNDDGTVDDTEIIREITPGGATMIDGPNNIAGISLAEVDGSLKSSTLSYRGNGTLAVNLGLNDDITFTICDKRAGEKGREIVISRTGRARLADNQYSCP